MRIKTKSELLATGLYTKEGNMYYHKERSYLIDRILGKNIVHVDENHYLVDGEGTNESDEWYINIDAINYKEDNVLKILAKVDAL